MTVVTSSLGVERDVELDFDRICAYEKEHPDWSILDLIAKIDRLRFTDLDLLVGFLGFPDYRTFVDEGFDIDDIGDLLSKSRYLGFTDSVSERD